MGFVMSLMFALFCTCVLILAAVTILFLPPIILRKRKERKMARTTMMLETVSFAYIFSAQKAFPASCASPVSPLSLLHLPSWHTRYLQLNLLHAMKSSWKSVPEPTHTLLYHSLWCYFEFFKWILVLFENEHGSLVVVGEWIGVACGLCSCCGLRQREKSCILSLSGMHNIIPQMCGEYSTLSTPYHKVGPIFMTKHLQILRWLIRM